jgi:hypothetical protein
LRNKWLHPERQKISDLNDDSKIQELLDNVHKVYVCMYHITFALIGYEGRFTNYASRGFNEKGYPLPVESSGDTSA